MARHQQSRGDLDTLRDDVERLRADLGQMLQQIGGEGREKVSQKLVAFRDRAKDTGKRAIDSGKHAIEVTEHQIHERPFLSVLVVFLVGLLFGRILQRS